MVFFAAEDPIKFAPSTLAPRHQSPRQTISDAESRISLEDSNHLILLIVQPIE